MTTPLLRVGDVMERLQVSRGWLYAHLDEVPHLRVGRLLRFDPDALDAYLQGRAAVPVADSPRPTGRVRKRH